jgi:GNAT superfamily N-acetyltransferase
MIWVNGAYELDTDRDRLDMDQVSAWIRNAYWAVGRSHEQVLASWAASAVPFGLYGPGGMVGCARVISDMVTTAYLADVFLVETERGKGLGLWMMQSIVAHPDLCRLRWLLHTRDAHELYRKVGFDAPSERVMERPQS